MEAVQESHPVQLGLQLLFRSGVRLVLPVVQNLWLACVLRPLCTLLGVVLRLAAVLVDGSAFAEQ